MKMFPELCFSQSNVIVLTAEISERVHSNQFILSLKWLLTVCMYFCPVTDLNFSEHSNLGFKYFHFLVG